MPEAPEIIAEMRHFDKGFVFSAISAEMLKVKL